MPIKPPRPPRADRRARVRTLARLAAERRHREARDKVREEERCDDDDRPHREPHHETRPHHAEHEPERHRREEHCEEPRHEARREERCEEPPCEPERVRKVVERTWYFGPGGDDCRPEGDDCGDGRPGRPPGGGRPGPGKPGSGRPTRPPGNSTGRLGPPGTAPPGLNTGDINNPNPPGVFVGGRTQLDLPYLFMRANPADLGARPIVSPTPFWESPDIYLLGGVDPSAAPPIPAQLGQIAQAGAPNTIYAHIWNFGNASANEVVVEFYWVNPSLGINPSTVNLIAQTFTQIGSKGSGDSHVVVKCPVAWVPTFVNGGHECLLVRVWDNPADLPGVPTFDASWNRHVAQRNIHVDAAGAAQGHAMQAAPLHKAAGGPALQQPILINVGPLFGAPAQVAVERVAPSAVPWLQLHTGQRGVFPAMAAPTGVPTLSPAAGTAGGFPPGGGAATQTVHGDDQFVAFNTTDDAPNPGEAHVYRVSATQAGGTFGGYTIVLLG